VAWCFKNKKMNRGCVFVILENLKPEEVRVYKIIALPHNLTEMFFIKHEMQTYK